VRESKYISVLLGVDPPSISGRIELGSPLWKTVGDVLAVNNEFVSAKKPRRFHEIVELGRGQTVTM
jgi:hypothetical protein